LIIAIDAEDREKSKVKYELDTWAFALLGYLNQSRQDYAIRCIVQTSEQTDQRTLQKMKWFYFLTRRLAFLNQSRKMTLEILSTKDSPRIEPYAIPTWRDVLVEGADWEPYKESELDEREPKEAHSAEDREQCRIIGELEANGLRAQKEFPICFRRMAVSMSDDAAYRMDIVFRDDDTTLGIIELKVAKNKELDAFAQCLDYFIYLSQIKGNLRNSGWLDYFRMERVDRIKCYLYCEEHHPAAKIVCNTYRRSKFDICYKKQNKAGLSVTYVDIC